eukprot:1761943-Amphidinium_carterae.1
MSTGLYPQEILLQLQEPARISSIQLVTTNVKQVRIEGCSEASMRGHSVKSTYRLCPISFQYYPSFPTVCLEYICEARWFGYHCQRSSCFPCSQEEPVNFKPVADGDLDERGGRLQIKEMQCSDASDVRFIKVLEVET